MVKKNIGKNTKLIIGIVLAAAVLIGVVFWNIHLNSTNADELPPTPTPTHGQSGQDISIDGVGDDIGANANTSTGVNYYAEYRTNRELMRNEEIDYLNQIIENSATDAETLKDAQEQLLEIVSCMESEFTIESMLLAKGFSDVAVSFHYGSVTVVIDAVELTNEQIAQILDIVRRETGEPAENIKISTHSSQPID
ncbi:MAG: SpoIIIAH-like family protein [Clostridia bacterium]|nr:SpoIIIAH-like family protein [Clostridia bacterium]